MKTILHIINKSSLRCHSMTQLQTLTAPQDGVLFIEDGVYNTVNTDTNNAVLAIIKGEVSVLLPDLKARGYQQQDLISDVCLVDYDKFVDLTLNYDIVRSW